MQKKTLLVWVAKIAGHSTFKKKKINASGAGGYSNKN